MGVGPRLISSWGRGSNLNDEKRRGQRLGTTRAMVHKRRLTSYTAGQSEGAGMHASTQRERGQCPLQYLQQQHPRARASMSTAWGTVRSCSSRASGPTAQGEASRKSERGGCFGARLRLFGTGQRRPGPRSRITKTPPEARRGTTKATATTRGSKEAGVCRLRTARAGSGHRGSSEGAEAGEGAGRDASWEKAGPKRDRPPRHP